MHKLDFTITVPKDSNLNFGTTSQQISFQPKPQSVSSGQDSTLATYKPSFFKGFINWFVDLLPKVIVQENGERIPVETSFWKRAVGYVAMGVALPVIGVYTLLEKMGCIKYNPYPE